MQHTSVNFSPLASASLSSGSVDLWLLDFSALAAEQSTQFSALVSVDEVTRAQRFKQNQHHFLATRVLLRKVLAIYTGLPSNVLEFARTQQGKPFLINTPAPLYFNLSHSGHFAALAISTQGEIGIDIETVRKRNYVNIAQRFFHADEFKQLMTYSEAQRELLFFKLWTLKEAFFKATGKGISAGLDKARFHFEDNNFSVNFSSELNAQAHEWQFKQEFIAPTTIVAIALNTAEPPEHQWFDGNALLAVE